jgi:hypothetical protein
MDMVLTWENIQKKELDKGLKSMLCVENMVNYSSSTYKIISCQVEVVGR